MEIGELVLALKETLVLLRASESSDYSSSSVEEIISTLELEINNAKKSQPIDRMALGLLFAPTGSLQETAIDNGWENAYLKISKVIDHFTESNNRG